MAWVSFRDLAPRLWDYLVYQEQQLGIPNPVAHMSSASDLATADGLWPPPPTVSLRYALWLGVEAVGSPDRLVQVLELSPPFEEFCTVPTQNVAPPELIEQPLTSVRRTDGPPHYIPLGPIKQYKSSEGRLNDGLRQVAQQASSLEVLIRAATNFYLLMSGPPGPMHWAAATADLSVTGRSKYADFARLAPQDVDLLSPVRDRLLQADPNGYPPDERTLGFAVSAALDRAYNVAWAIRDPNPITRAQRRKSLNPNWIAVSGEDDSPGRPVNVASAEFPQFDLDVVTQGITLTIRYMICLPEPVYASDVPASPIRRLPPVPVPSIPPDHEVILFIHGHDSRLEECNDLVNSTLGPPHPGPLLQAGLQIGKRYAVVALDLPCNGYSQMIDHTTATGGIPTHYDHDPTSTAPATYPLLDFLLQFIIDFVGALDQIVPIRDRIAAVIGGSLGANLCLRLGERNDQPWVKNIVAWSSASVWRSLNHSLVDPGLAVTYCFNQMWEPEGVNMYVGVPQPFPNPDAPAPSRLAFFHQVFDSPTGFSGPSQAQQWYRAGWTDSGGAGDCQLSYIEDDRAEREEIYNPLFRRWHWRVALEQLLFSHWSLDAYAHNKTRTLLIAGAIDDYPHAQIYTNTKDLSVHMWPTTPGDSVFVTNTGHSIHNERPVWLSQQILQFLVS
jgi:pimeloyl-ACP methyl ester carboxylesterase